MENLCPCMSLSMLFAKLYTQHRKTMMNTTVKELLYNSHGNMAICDSDFSTKIALFPLWITIEYCVIINPSVILQIKAFEIWFLHEPSKCAYVTCFGENFMSLPFTGHEIEWAWSFRMLLYDNLNQLNALNRSLMWYVCQKIT